MNLPNKAQSVYANMKMLEPVLHFIRDNLIDSEFDDLELVSDFDKARLSLKVAIAKMEELAKKAKEPKRVCY